MSALPLIVVEGPRVNFQDGSLFKLPPELNTTYQMNWYVNQAVRGWNRCPQGYCVYVAVDQSGTKYIVPGLNIEGEKRPSRKYYDSPYFFSKQKVEAFVSGVIEERSDADRTRAENLGDLIHDLRALSSAIYNSATAARDEYDIGHATARDRIETVIATQTMLSIRIDFLDYLSSQLMLTEMERIDVFRKVDKVVRCFRPKANTRRINLFLRGPSFGATYGPAIFELVPYAIIDNAVKYAPFRTDISVDVIDKEKEIYVCVESLGPLIDPPERTKIFEKGYRGIHASQFIPSGTGIGLHTAKELLEKYFNGTISVTQENTPTIIGGHSYFPTRFELVVPRHEDRSEV